MTEHLQAICRFSVCPPWRYEEGGGTGGWRVRIVLEQTGPLGDQDRPYAWSPPHARKMGAKKAAARLCLQSLLDSGDRPHDPFSGTGCNLDGSIGMEVFVLPAEVERKLPGRTSTQARNERGVDKEPDSEPGVGWDGQRLTLPYRAEDFYTYQAATAAVEAGAAAGANAGAGAAGVAEGGRAAIVVESSAREEQDCHSAAADVSRSASSSTIVAKTAVPKSSAVSAATTRTAAEDRETSDEGLLERLHACARAGIQRNAVAALRARLQVGMRSAAELH